MTSIISRIIRESANTPADLSIASRSGYGASIAKVDSALDISVQNSVLTVCCCPESALCFSRCSDKLVRCLHSAEWPVPVVSVVSRNICSASASPLGDSTAPNIDTKFITVDSTAAAAFPRTVGENVVCDVGFSFPRRPIAHSMSVDSPDHPRVRWERSSSGGDVD